MSVFDILRIPGGCVHICKVCVATTGIPLATGLGRIRRVSPYVGPNFSFVLRYSCSDGACLLTRRNVCLASFGQQVWRDAADVLRDWTNSSYFICEFYKIFCPFFYQAARLFVILLWYVAVPQCAGMVTKPRFAQQVRVTRFALPWRQDLRGFGSICGSCVRVFWRQLNRQHTRNISDIQTSISATSLPKRSVTNWDNQPKVELNLQDIYPRNLCCLRSYASRYDSRIHKHS